MTTGRRRAAREAQRAAEQERARRRVRRVGLPVLVAVGVVAVLAVLAGVFLVHDHTSPTRSVAVSGRAQQTLLVQVVPSVGQAAVANALTASDRGGGDGVFLAIPGELVTNLPDGGTTTLSQTTVSSDGSGSVDAVSDELGVIVDGSWLLTEPALAELVDKVGGVTVDVDVAVTQKLPTGATQVVVPAGSAQHLDGAQAVAYATFQRPGEPAQAGLARFTAVWTALVGRLPDGSAAVRNLVTGSAGSVSTFPPDRLADYLAQLHAAAVSDSIAYPELPTTPVETGSATTVAYALDTTKAPALVKQQFAGSLPPTPPGGPITVLVQTGVATPGIAEKARADLVAKGLTFEGGGAATRQDYQKSLVLIPDASITSRAKGQAVAQALGLPASAVEQSAQGQSVADVVVILGADFR